MAVLIVSISVLINYRKVIHEFLFARVGRVPLALYLH
jgi:hypothetical protein